MTKNLSEVKDTARYLEIQRLVLQGRSLAEIGRYFGISRQRVFQALKRKGLSYSKLVLEREKCHY